MRGEINLALLGDPVSHSRSPAIHRAALASLGLSGSYEARRTGEEGLHEAIEELRSGALDGINITMPLKTLAAGAADRLTSLASRSGSVNTLRARDGEIEGHSSDAAAAIVVFEGTRFDRDAPILVLGAGGAAAAVISAIEGRSIFISARREQAAREMEGRTGRKVTVLPFGEVVPGAIVVNATPVGMHGESLPASVMESASGLVDLAYGPVDPPSTVRARMSGLPLVDGVEFLALQAGESFTWWTGLAAPMDVMLAAAKNG
ncbi:MAG TPA: hypothetical protein VFL72_01980 [Acidimicrobiia bacterium]|nr:hypothetical protein [Acidimicrobiia bacterium]